MRYGLYSAACATLTHLPEFASDMPSNFSQSANPGAQQKPDCAVPDLTTAHQGPLLRFESLLKERAADIEAWFRRQWRSTPPPFYGSVDLRNAGFKLAPVDTNLFPAGFNNLNPAFEPLCVQALQAAFERLMPTACGVLLIPENHTRNQFYLENVAVLQELMRNAGYKVELGSLREDLHEAETLTLDSGREVLLHPLQRTGDSVGIDGFTPCVVVLNNDLSSGRPAILENLDQPVTPPLGVGWSSRLKTQHFDQYRKVTTEFGALLDMDPWWLTPLFRNCGHINFKAHEGEDCVAANVDALLADIRTKYAEYGVEEEPFVIVKADAGTYGMGVMTVKSGDEVRHLNRGTRKKMSATKGGREVQSVIIQEGVPTLERVDSDGDVPGGTAEPVVYMIDHYVVGGFYRVNGARSTQENLNAPGAHFKQLAFAEPGAHPRHGGSGDCDCATNRFYAYGVVARLALLAAAREIAHVQAVEPGITTTAPMVAA
ncbi:MAG TPA: glutamate--cysteine ligase [Nevskiaceae bacterium]|nr:glutamate--cysteine ligase [Nevskiaceae bacterium]